MSSSFIAQRATSLSLYKNLLKLLTKNKHAAGTAFTDSFLELLRKEFDSNSVSDAKYCAEKDQQKFLGNAYLAYLENTEKTLELYSTYSKGERSTEEAAAIVGLRLPKLFNEQPKKD
jgi:hypothetical protein